jgi:hypothetical protein
VHLAGARSTSFVIGVARLSLVERSSTMLPFLSFHALVAQRGDGLRPELLALFERHARSETGLDAIIEPVETENLSQVAGAVFDGPEKE